MLELLKLIQGYTIAFIKLRLQFLKLCSIQVALFCDSLKFTLKGMQLI